MTHQEAVEKAVKLLRLSTSSNPNEAALAASKAQEIIDRYKLGALSADFDNPVPAPDEPIKDFAFDPLDPSPRSATWKGRLVMTIAKGNQCKVYITSSTRGSGFAIVGRPSDASAVRYLYQWLKGEVERLADSNCRGCGVTYVNNFRIGVVETVCNRLRAQQKETETAVRAEAGTGTMALVRVNNAIALREKQLADVEAWCDRNLHLRSRGRSAGRYDPSAREAGRQAGYSVRISPTRGSLSSIRNQLT